MALAVPGAIADDTNCVSSLNFALVQATTAGCNLVQVTPTKYESTSTVTVNGVPFWPLPGTKITLNLPSSTSPGGSISVSLAQPISVAGVNWEPQNASLNWQLPAGGPGNVANVVETGPLAGSLYGLELKGEARVRIGCSPAPNSVCYWGFYANLELPSIFKNGPEEGAGGLTGKVDLLVDKNGVHVNQVEVRVANAYIGALQVKDLCLSYLAPGSTAEACALPSSVGKDFSCNTLAEGEPWTGSAEIVLPTTYRPSVAVWAGVSNRRFSYAGGAVSNLGNSVPLAQGIFLSSARLAVCVNPAPLKFRGSGGINIGVTPPAPAKPPVTLDGEARRAHYR